MIAGHMIHIVVTEWDFCIEQKAGFSSNITLDDLMTCFVNQ